MTRQPQPSIRSFSPTPAGDALLSEAAQNLRAEISAYPGTITYIDLIRRNKRVSVVLIVVMILLGVMLGVLLSCAIAIYGGVRDLLPSALLGGVVALVVASLGATWAWFGGAGAILAMAGAQEITKAEDPQLYNVVDEMRLAAGIPMPRVYLIPDSALNAFATGRDPSHAAVAVTTGLRQVLSRDELQGVIAHEIAHIRHYDIRFSLLMATMVGLIVFACDAFRRIVFYGPRGGVSLHGGRGGGGGGGGGKDSKGGGIVVLILILALVLSVIAPMIAFFIQMAYSRQREYLADAGAVELTRNPGGLAAALMKLADDPEPLVDNANRGTAHMFIVNPLRKMHDSHQALDSAFASHPPVQKRIARLLALTR